MAAKSAGPMERVIAIRATPSGSAAASALEPLLLKRVERLRIADQPDRMAGARLRLREIAHVAERAAHGRADHVKDGKLFAHGFPPFAPF